MNDATRELRVLLAAVDEHWMPEASEAARGLLASIERGQVPDYSLLTPHERRLLAEILADLVLNYWEPQ